MKISIVMPIYNGENYIEKSIKKILNQPYRDIELILVNDGSKDQSRAICEKFQMNDSRVRLLNKSNGGICSARNEGLKNIHGDYVSFVDQDDMIFDNIYESFSKAINEHNADMIIAGKSLKLLDSKNKLIKKIDYIYGDHRIRGNKVKEKIFNIDGDMMFMHLWNCLYKTSVIINQNIKFDQYFKFGHEDTMFNIEFSAKCNSIYTISSVVYEYYRRYGESTSLRSNKDYLSDFSYFINKTSTVLMLDNKDENNEFFSMGIRLGLSLYRQYARDESNDQKGKDLIYICKVCKKITNEKIILRKNVNKISKYIVLNLIIFMVNLDILYPLVRSIK